MIESKDENIQDKNLSHYENAYSVRYYFKFLLKHFLSYDQHSKTRRNILMARKVPNYNNSISVLDYGFGLGTFIAKLPRRHKISGCELSTAAINNVGKICSFLKRNVNLYTIEEFSRVAEDPSFELICCSHVIEHVKDDETLLSIFHAMLKDAGYLLLNVPINEVWSDPKHLRTYTAESLKSDLNRAGFIVISMQEVDRWSAWLLTREYVSGAKPKILIKLIRLILALSPVYFADSVERILPEKYKFQQLLVLAKKV